MADRFQTTAHRNRLRREQQAQDDRLAAQAQASAHAGGVGGWATAEQGAKADTAVQSVVAGTNIEVDSTDPQNPIVTATFSGGAEIPVVVGDETTNLTTGLAKYTFRMPFAMSVSAVRMSVNVAPVGSAIQVDVNEEGLSMFSVPPTIDAGEKTTFTAATPPVITRPNLADDAEITVDIDQVGSTTPGRGLKLWLLGTRGATGTPDPHYASVVALLHFDGTNGSATFTDETGKTWTRSGNAAISTAQQKYGNASGSFDGSGDFITVPNSSDFDFGSGDFTIEAWIYPFTEPAASTYRGIFCKRNASGDNSFTFFLSRDGGTPSVRGMFTAAVGGAQISAESAMPPINEWSHVAVVRNGNMLQCFTNGVGGTAMDVGAGAIRVTTITPAIGRMSLTASIKGDFDGYIDEVRVTKGVARYTSDFTPPDAAFSYLD